MKKLKNLFVFEDSFFALIMMIFIIYYPNYYFLIFICWLILTYQLKRISLLILMTSALLLIRLQLSPHLITFNKAQIVNITPTQTIFRDSIFYASSFGTDYGEIGDKLKLDASLEVHQPSIYQKGLFLKNNLGLLNIKKSEVINKHHSSESFLRSKVSQLDEEIVSLYLYSEKDRLSQESSLYMALISSGIHFSSFLHIIRNIINKILKEKQVKWILFFIHICLILFFGMNFVLIRLLISNLLNLRGHKKSFVEIIILLLIYPFSINTPIFILTYGLKLSSFIVNNIQDNFLVRKSYLAFLQLNLFYRFNFIESLLFNLFRYLSGLMFLIALVSLSFSTSTLLNSLHLGLRFLIRKINVEVLTIVGKPHLLVNCLWFMVLVLWENRELQKIVGVCFIILQTLLYRIDGSVRVIYIDVGQGDATLIKYPYHQGALLIDTGKENQYASVKSQLYKSGIKQLSSVIITHPDEDHNGSLSLINDQFQPKNIITKPTLLKEPLNIMFLLEERVSEGTNDQSLIVLFKVQDTQFLFTGDASEQIEMMLIKKYPLLQADILKLGHHGSKTSSHPRFLQQMNPKLAIISSDPKTYNHPHPSVMKSLYDLRINSLQTSSSSTIEVVVSRYFTLVKTQQKIYFLN